MSAESEAADIIARAEQARKERETQKPRPDPGRGKSSR